MLIGAGASILLVEEKGDFPFPSLHIPGFAKGNETEMANLRPLKAWGLGLALSCDVDNAQANDK